MRYSLQQHDQSIWDGRLQKDPQTGPDRTTLVRHAWAVAIKSSRPVRWVNAEQIAQLKREEEKRRRNTYGGEKLTDREFEFDVSTTIRTRNS